MSNSLTGSSIKGLPFSTLTALGGLAATRSSIRRWEPSFHRGLVRPSLRSVLRRGLAYERDRGGVADGRATRARDRARQLAAVGLRGTRRPCARSETRRRMRHTCTRRSGCTTRSAQVATWIGSTSSSRRSAISSCNEKTDVGAPQGCGPAAHTITSAARSGESASVLRTRS